jgi:tetratricopeptide (TPR) repeat protein
MAITNKIVFVLLDCFQSRLWHQEGSMSGDKEPEKDSTKILMQGRFPNFLLCLLLAAAALAVYWPVQNYNFINLDDPTYVAENGHVQAGLTGESFIWAFTATDTANWHPLTWISLMLDCQLYGLNPAGHHLTNVLLHTASTILLSLVLFGMTGSRWCSAFVAALFALHPLHVESVAWVAERKDVLSTLFWMLTLWAYLGYTQRPGVIRYLLIMLTFALGLMAKPMLVTLPCVLLLLDYWPLQRIELGQSAPGLPAAASHPSSTVEKPGGHAFRLLLEKTPLFVLAAVSSVVTFLVQKSEGAVGALEVYPLKIRIANALVSYVSYIIKMIWPQNLAVFYPHPGQSLPMWQAAAAGLLLVLLSIAVIRAGRRQPYLPVGWFWYLGTLVPVIGLVQVGAQAMADRYTYVPLIGLFIMAAWGVPELMEKWHHRRAALGVSAALVLFALMTCARLQLRHWKNSIALLSHTHAVTAPSYLVHNNLGSALNELGKYDEAIAHYTEALRIRPNVAEPHYNLGTALARQGKLRESISHYTEALRIEPGYAEACNNLGEVLRQQERYDEAISYYSKALQLRPDYPEAHSNLGIALAQQGKLKKAMAHFSEALRLQPDYAAAHFNLALALVRQERLEEAVAHFYEALRTQPDDADTHYNLGVTLEKQGRLEEAMIEFAEVLRIQPDNGEAHTNLGLILARQGRFKEAISHYSKALQLKSNDEETHNNLGVALFTVGQVDRAIDHYLMAIKLDPTFSKAHNNLGNALARKGKLEEAIAHYTRALELKPNYPEAHNNLGVALAQQGKMDEAIVQFDQALRLKPDYPQARTNLGYARDLAKNNQR